MATILTTEDALLAKIKGALMPAGGQKVRAVESLDGAWDEDALKRVLRLVPAVFVWFGGGQPAPGQQATMAGEWVTYVVTANASGAAARRRGDGLAVGAYELIEVLVSLLHRFVVPDVGTLTFNGIECLFNGAVDKQGVCVYAISWKLGMTFPAEVAADTLTPFETFAAIYDTPPFDTPEHQHWLAGDESVAKPDAKDTVLPEQS
jgi:phage gp37-like protein